MVLPSSYTATEFIRTDSDGMFITSYKLKAGHKVEMKVLLESGYTQNDVLWGATDSTNKYGMVNVYNNKFEFYFNGTSLANPAIPTLNTPWTVLADFTSGAMKLTVNGSVLGTSSTTSTYEYTTPIGIMGMYKSDGTTSDNVKGRFYYLKVYNESFASTNTKFSKKIKI